MQLRQVVCTLVLTYSCTVLPGIAASPEFPRAFHVAGVPETKRGQRIDVRLTGDGLDFEGKGVSYRVPYTRIHRVLILRAERRYEKTTIGAAIATGALGIPIGELLILTKHRVD